MASLQAQMETIKTKLNTALGDWHKEEGRLKAALQRAQD